MNDALKQAFVTIDEQAGLRTADGAVSSFAKPAGAE